MIKCKLIDRMTISFADSHEFRLRNFTLTDELKMFDCFAIFFCFCFTKLYIKSETSYLHH